MGMIKGRNSKDQMDALEINKKLQGYTEETEKKCLNDTDNNGGEVTHLEPDILGGEVKWALETITMNKACEGARIPAELLQILKDDAVKVLHNFLKLNSGHRTGKVQFSSQSQRRAL